MARMVSLVCVVLALASCGSGLSVDPALADSIHQIGQVTTGQLDLTRDDWVDIAKEACERGAHLDTSEAERIARDRGVVFIGTDEPVVETVQVIGAAVCSTNSRA